MSGRSPKKQPVAARHHCRYCNHKLDTAKQRCPVCKRGQERLGEVIALALMTAILGVCVYLLLNEEGIYSGIYEEEALQQFEIAYAVPGETTPAPSVFPPFVNEPTQSFSRSISPTQLRPPKAAPLVHYQGTAFKQNRGNFPFYVADKKWNSKSQRYEFFRRGMDGDEVTMRGEARRHFLSENQSDYPEPESGCGPTALLNLYIWYSKFGLLQESIQHANHERYKQLKFSQIDRKLLDIQKESRTRYGGTNTLASIVAMDELVQQYSKGPTRLHFEIKQPPLSQSDFTQLSRNYRAGILSVKPKDPKTGQLLSNHAVLCTLGDRAGMITIANWGEFSQGRLVNRKDGQWFIPSDRSDHELKINNLTLLIPFTPKSGS